MKFLSFDDHKDLLNKCLYEENKLRCSQGKHPEYQYLIFNIVISLNHLFEWFMKNNQVIDENKKNCIKNFNPYKSSDDVNKDFMKFYDELDEFPPINEYQLLIRKLCNKAKHFNIRPIEERKKQDITCAGESSMNCGEISAVCGNFVYSYFVHNDNGDDICIKSLISEQIVKWKIFLECNV